MDTLAKQIYKQNKLNQNVRDRIKEKLKKSSCTATELAIVLRIPPSTIKHNLNYLIEARWIYSRNGNYNLRTEEARRKLLIKEGLVVTSKVVEEKVAIAA